MARRIEKKTWPQYFQDVLAGKKRFDLRLADFDCQVGDTLILREWDPETKQYTGREIEKQINYLVRSQDFPTPSADVEKYGYIVLGLD